MGQHVIKMPDIGEGIAEVELVAWHVKPGDTVKEDQVLADVMTDKANVEIPSPVNGTVVALGGEVGQVMAVGSELIRLEVAEAAGAGQRSLARAVAADVVAPAPREGGAQNEPAAPQRADAVRGGLSNSTLSAAQAVSDYGAAAPARSPRAASTDRATPTPPGASTPGLDEARPIASPSVRRRAWELDVDLREVRGTGPGGRIMHSDLELHAARHGRHAGAVMPTAERMTPAPSPAVDRASARADSASSATPPAAPRALGVARDDLQAIPVIGVRRKIAQKMQEAKRRIPHFTYVEEIDVTELEALRAQLNARHAAERGKLTILPFLVRALVRAAAEFPQVNARFDDEAGVVTRYGAVHAGIATQTDAGLMVPVLRHAEVRDLWRIASDVARLADAARAGRITRDELTGSTITLTSLGALGGVVSTPVINHPEVAIVGVNRIVERPAFRQGAVVPRLMMNLSSSFDHRVVDGMDAAKFVQAMRGYLEAPATLFIE